MFFYQSNRNKSYPSIPNHTHIEAVWGGGPHTASTFKKNDIWLLFFLKKTRSKIL